MCLLQFNHNHSSSTTYHGLLMCQVLLLQNISFLLLLFVHGTQFKTYHMTNVSSIYYRILVSIVFYLVFASHYFLLVPTSVCSSAWQSLCRMSCRIEFLLHDLSASYRSMNVSIVNCVSGSKVLQSINNWGIFFVFQAWSCLCHLLNT